MTEKQLDDARKPAMRRCVTRSDRRAASIQRGILEIDEGHFEDFDADGLRRLGAELVAQSARKKARQNKQR